MAIDPSAVWDFAREVVGGARRDRGRTLATVTRVDPDGTTWVTTGDGGEAPATSVAAGVSVGDTVTLEWDGSAMGIRSNVSDPAPPGSSIRRAVDRARGVASAAQKVADAVNQHFFANDSGIHVTEATQDEWDTSHSGANVLINSIGQLFRDGLNNLLTLTTEGNARALTVWDGLGNTADHIRAIIGETIQLGNDAEKHVTIDSDSVELMDGDETLATFGANETHLGLAGTGTLYMADDKCKLYSENWTFGSADRQTTTLGTRTVMPSDEDAGSTTTLSFAHSVEDEMYDPAYGENWSEVVIDAHSGYSGSHSDASVTLTANYAKSAAHVAADEIYLQGSVHRTEGTCTATTANATIISGVNHCWTNNATTTITVGVNLKSSLANQGLVAVATVPSGFRPPYTVVGSAYVTGQVVNLQAWVDANGVISVNNRSGSSVSTSANIYLSFTYAM